MNNALKKGIANMLDQINDNIEFHERIKEDVYDDPEVNTEKETYERMIEDLNLDFKTCDPIYCSINAMVAEIARLAYKRGFLDGAETFIFEQLSQREGIKP